MKSIALILLAILLYSYQIVAQGRVAKGGIQGIVIDTKTAARLAGVNIEVEGLKIGTASDAEGGFIINDLPIGTYKVVFTYIGYAKKRLENVVVSQDKVSDIGFIGLEEEAFSLSQVTVTPGSFAIMGDENVSRQVLTAKDLKSMSWAEDITRAVARLPGISSSDYSSKFAIRGGEADEVLISLDGMELYKPFHQRDYSGGLLSIVDIETVQSVELMTGGFSADYGNRLSGVFNMKTKYIPDNQRHTYIGLSIMNARVYTDGKFANNKGSYLFSARRGMLDLTLKALGNEEVFPKFYDAMTKVAYALNDKQILSFHVLHSGDKTDINNSPEGDAIEIFSTKYNNVYSTRWFYQKGGRKDFPVYAKGLLLNRGCLF